MGMHFGHVDTVMANLVNREGLLVAFVFNQGDDFGTRFKGHFYGNIQLSA